jgi:hypothetical protein
MKEGLGMVVYLPITWEVEIIRISVQDQSGQKVSKAPYQPTKQAWWHLPVIPATWGAEAEEPKAEAGPGKKCKTLSKPN